ncbi:MAG: carboxypeptidase regulatory-like domain-containing protein [Saprospiraceae bacterium]|nr:carboxypeptidase regulatory-like domain-containing protein [Saprospiraceae bacterium]
MILDQIRTKELQLMKNGKFVIGELSPGRYMLQISYLGYELSNIPNILVTSARGLTWIL